MGNFDSVRKSFGKKIGRTLGLELGPVIKCFLRSSLTKEDQGKLENLPSQEAVAEWKLSLSFGGRMERSED